MTDSRSRFRYMSCVAVVLCEQSSCMRLMQIACTINGRTPTRRHTMHAHTEIEWLKLDSMHQAHTTIDSTPGGGPLPSLPPPCPSAQQMMSVSHGPAIGCGRSIGTAWTLIVCRYCNTLSILLSTPHHLRNRNIAHAGMMQQFMPRTEYNASARQLYCAPAGAFRSYVGCLCSRSCP